MTDRALARPGQLASFTKREATFITYGMLDNKMVATLIHRFPDMFKMIVYILFGNP